MSAKDLGFISLEHLPLVKDALERHPPEISEHTFTNLFIWRKARPLRVVELEDSLAFVEVSDGGISVFGPPVGSCQIANASKMLSALFKKPVNSFLRIPKNAMGKNPDGLEAFEDRDNFDYVYRRKDLVELSGNALHAKKNLVNQCLQSYDCAYEPISAKNIAEVVDFQSRWCESRKCGESHSLCHEFQAAREMMEHFSSLGAHGGIIRISGRVEAYSFGERLNPSAAVVHFEKASVEFKGLYQLMNKWFAEKTLEGFELVNREQDMGIEGLRKAKQSYEPSHLVEKFFIASKDVSSAETHLKMKRCGGEQ